MRVKQRIGIRSYTGRYLQSDSTRKSPSSEYGVLVELEEMSTADHEYGTLIKFDSNEAVMASEYGVPLTFRPRRYV